MLKKEPNVPVDEGVPNIWVKKINALTEENKRLKAQLEDAETLSNRRIAELQRQIERVDEGRRHADQRNIVANQRIDELRGRLEITHMMARAIGLASLPPGTLG